MAKKNRGTGGLAFKKVLRELAKERGLTVKQIAELANVSKSVAQGWLQGANPHDLHAVNRLARGLGVSFKNLLLGEDEYVLGAQTLAELFDEEEVFDGICKLKVSKLTPRKRG